MAEPTPKAYQCNACIGGQLHISDCAVHNEPAMTADPCDCGAQAAQETPPWQVGLTATEIANIECLVAWIEADLELRSAWLKAALAVTQERAARCSDSKQQGPSAQTPGAGCL